MPGSLVTPAFPRPVEVGLRALVAAALVLIVLSRLSGAIIEPLVPAIAYAVRLVDPDFVILDSTVERDQPGMTLLMQANTA